MKQLYIIELCGNRYEVAIEGTERMIQYRGEWITASRFVDTLASWGMWDEICELAKLGMNNEK